MTDANFSAWKPLSPLRYSLETPHHGYHWHGQRRFFEGWYYRLTLPEQTIAFMYSIQDPAGGSPPSGSAVQILGPDEQYFCRTFSEVGAFWADADGLSHGCSRHDQSQLHSTNFKQCPEGYCATAQVQQGFLRDPGTGKEIRWYYTIEPIYGWGNPKGSQQATAGWLSYLPIFEPGWQVLMAHGLATGWLEAGGSHYQLDRVPFYAEKNWGGAFPSKWFWLQCNAFGTDSDLTVTSGGGLRRMLGQVESVGMVGIHWRGQFYEFVPWNSRVNWAVSPWGRWKVWAENGKFSVELVGSTTEAGVMVRVPTATGLEFRCRDTTRGKLALRLWHGNGDSRQLLLHAVSDQAGLEVGGEPWDAIWRQNDAVWLRH